LSYLRAILRFGRDAGYLKDIPLKSVDTPTRDRVGEVVIMPPAEVRRILEMTLSYMPELFAMVLVQIFCGVRTAEACRLRWADVDLLRERLTIRATVSKTRAGRTITLMPCAVAWFQHYIEQGHPHTGPFTTLSHSTTCQRMPSLHRLLGYAGAYSSNPGKQSWHPGILRDTFASCNLAYHDSIDRLIREMGHTNFSTTRNHYLGLVTKEVAAEFWNLFPSSGDKIVPLPVISA
jgi:integrase